MRRLLILTITLLAVALLTACGGDDTTGGDEDNTGPGSIFGTYTLITVNGEELPVEIQAGITITSGTLRLNSDNTYSISTPAIFQDEPVTFTDTGTFTVDGSTIQFSGVSSGDSSGTISGNTLTVSAEGFTFVYRK